MDFHDRKLAAYARLTPICLDGFQPRPVEVEEGVPMLLITVA
jgi:hypothetical protein